MHISNYRLFDSILKFAERTMHDRLYLRTYMYRIENKYHGLVA